MDRNLKLWFFILGSASAVVLMIMSFSLRNFNPHQRNKSEGNAEIAQPTQIEVTNDVKEYEGVIVEGPFYLAHTEMAVVGVEIEVDGYKVIKPALISNFTYAEMHALIELKQKVKIIGTNIHKKGESPLFIWIVQHIGVMR
ncbi:MAG: hypothetical protein A2Y67_02480 [Candidatus Buchananbacteria bacterium RBG_13_39_9]|uniref:Uncharacterized protein n=1 Tax=Candidatus Buchananbacteria bacterium RBG_13_39_9 TaxID=1797531 RepID=A0A1G1XS10_9BACT|nr:MAG: hypothetical protein A2Y67_02480 [Candidatus Buchananbacteria bacterium RBG_13_39_9]